MMDVALTPSCGLIIDNTHLHSVRMEFNNDMASKYHVVIGLVGSSFLLHVHVHPPPHAY